MPKSKKPNRARATKRSVSDTHRHKALQTGGSERHRQIGMRSKHVKNSGKPPLFPGRTGGR
ncbi:MAG: hypothetical protein ABJL99_13930 [Aliishimia sp.]